MTILPSSGFAWSLGRNDSHVISIFVFHSSIFHRTDGLPCLCPLGYHGFHCEYEQAQVPVEQYCSLDCANGGTCILGLVNPSQATELERIWGSEDIVGTFDQMQCLCPPGFGGPLCQARQETCGEGDEYGNNSDSSPTVPSHFCYHGGQCVTTTTIINTIHGDESEGQSSYHCDCTTALDDQGNRFTGDYCQVQSTIFCDSTDPSFFCTHGGACPRLSHQPCICPDGFEGHKCEYATTTSAPTPTVSINPHADAAAYAVPVRCGDIMCLHGSECSTREGSNGLEEYCDCSATYRPDLYQAFAGKACQYQATTLCPMPQEDEGNGDSTSANLSFCVHHGTCLQAPDEDGSQCTCPDGWMGPHCELEASLDPNEETSLPACGDTVCYHGGKCVQTSVTTQGDDESITQVVEHYCDCSQAYDDEFLYSGKSCEYPSTSICDESLSSKPGHFFCANHGICLFKNLQQACICRAGFSGLHCEYLDVEPNDDENADAAGSNEPLVNQCDDSSYCRNGGTCLTTPVKSNGQIQYVSHCDCSTTATNNTIFAGPHCEHAATSYCTDPFDGDSTGADKVVTSTLFCVQGGTCRDNVFEGCDCPVGWTGFRCEYPIDVQELVDGEDADKNVPPPTSCGDNVCYHGGICVTSEQEDPVSGNLQDLFSCDCSKTVTTLVDGTIEIYGGPTCSTKSTSVCQAATADDPSELLVCMNHGTCRDDPTKGCDCPSGFTGKICDIEVEDDSHKDQGVPCGDSYCYHGGTCDSVRITDPDGKVTLMDYCDCSPAVDEDHLYAGASCQYKSTSFCTHPTRGLSLEGTRFCVNGGTCRESGFEQGCDCPPGWTGFSCEIPQDPQDALDADLVVVHEVCGENVCLNGGTCVTARIFGANGTSSSIQYCDCNMAHDEDHLFAGPNCEYPSSTLCANPDSDAANLLGTPFCVNGGTCHQDHVLGECSCPSHWVGFRCEFPADGGQTDNSEICSDDDDGQYVCQHGGRCDGTGCNCEAAIEGTMRYDGLYCQYPATEYCDNPLEQSSTTLSSVDFCVNGGKCQEGQACACPTGYYGPRCEMTIYLEDTAAVDRTPDNDDEVDTNSPVEYNCRLSCSNGGSCVKGAKDGSHGVYGQAIGQVAHLNMTFDETLFEHCVCPPGFIGLLCEHVVETCDGASAGGKGGEHYCFHGSKCVYDSSGKPYCDCDDAQARIDGQLETVFGGSSCQHRASDICMTHDGDADDGDEDSSNHKNNMFLTRPLYFCVNQGQCREYVTMDDPDPGCDCPSEWLGPHCEIYKSVESQLGSSLFDDDEFSDDEDERRTGLLVWTTLLLLMVLGYLLVRARRLSRESLDPSPTKPEEEDGVQGEGEEGTGVVGATDHWSYVIRNCFLARRTMGRDDGIPPLPLSSSSMWSSASSLSKSAAATKGLPQDFLSGSMNLAPTRRSTLMHDDEVAVKRNTGLSPPSSSSLSPLSDLDDDRQLFVDDDTAEGGGSDMDIEII